MNEEMQRIRGYLVAQGAKLSPPEIIDKVRAAMDQLLMAAETVPVGRFNERPAPDDWSGNEVLAHVVASGRNVGDAITRILDGLPAGGMRDRLERAVPRHRLAEWWALLERDRAALFRRVREADPCTRLDATVEHPFFGPLNWREALLFVRLHDLDHARQLQKIAAALAPTA